MAEVFDFKEAGNWHFMDPFVSACFLEPWLLEIPAADSLREDVLGMVSFGKLVAPLTNHTGPLFQHGSAGELCRILSSGTTAGGSFCFPHLTHHTRTKADGSAAGRYFKVSWRP